MATTLQVKNLDGKSGGSVEGSEKLFGAKINTGLIYQAIQAETKNSRQGTQSTKTRGVVHHTTRKPYKQKGTGRARQGMTSAPHYRHGGVAMGPLPRDLHADLPKKMKRAAIAAALTSKANDGVVTVTETITFDTISTKQAAVTLGKLGVSGKVLLVISEHNPILYKSFRNIPGMKVRVAPAFSTRDIVDAQVIVFTRDALSKIEAVWGGPASSKAETEPVAEGAEA